LLAAVAIQALNLPLMDQTSAVARGLFTVSFMLSILATFFTCIQQREFGVIRSPLALRNWLSSGVVYHNADGRLLRRSSESALQLLGVPYELLSMSVASIVGGMAAYLGSAKAYSVHLSVAGRGDMAVILAFATITGFTFSLFPLLLGTKSREIKAAETMFAGPLSPQGISDNSGASVENTSQISHAASHRFSLDGVEC
jgi:hypothetical protein